MQDDDEQLHKDAFLLTERKVQQLHGVLDAQRRIWITTRVAAGPEEQVFGERLGS